MSIGAGSGVGGNNKLYVDEVFSAYLYTGNGGQQAINNGINLIGSPTMRFLHP